MKKALEGVRILDLTRVLAGPYASMVLSDLGAEIIKIETPGSGDDSRGYGPFLNGESGYFMSVNRNKKSLTLNLKTEEGKQIFFELLKDADVIMENFRPGTMEKLGLAYEELEKANPGIIYAACSGFGHSGPYSQKAAYDIIVQAMSGMMSITGTPGGPPTRTGASIGDITAGLFTAIGILSALFHRMQTGQGQKVDVAMLDGQVAILENAVARYFATGKSPEPIGNRHPSITPFSVFSASDGYLIIAAGNDYLWSKWCEAVDRIDLEEDPRFKTNSDRTEHWEQLETIMNDVIGTKTVEEWLELFERNGIPSGPINNLEKVVQHPQVLAREMIVYQDHPVAGRVMMPGIPIKLSKTPGEITAPAPLLGEHTQSILTNLGYTDDEICRLKELGVI
ncbi:CaiB/BaiF CoA transferase family protein [Ferviditalea candida]|uniref:CoA transferase n=1 Tax=Ferviditalea candida TaxID=3108399 RepID=A0ABU5ZC60_9BACL|nr:CoA transferase [Paenibacillaceae bacterium T2]